MFYQIKSYLQFLSRSTNQHGVHSPFVFDYLTKCLYLKKVDSKSKTLDILLKSISYFEFKNVRIIGNENIKKLVSQRFPEIRDDGPPYDLICIEEIIPNLLSEILSAEQIHNNSMILMDNIYKKSSASELWKQIIKEKNATVTIDFYYCGVAFSRKEQVKEHFKIRI